MTAQEAPCSSCCVTDLSFLFLNFRLLESEEIDFGLNMSCEMLLRSCSLPRYLKEFRALTRCFHTNTEHSAVFSDNTINCGALLKNKIAFSLATMVLKYILFLWWNQL